MTLGIFLWSLLTALSGLVFNFISLICVRFLTGASQAMFPSPGWKAIGIYFPQRERATAISIQYTATALGPAFATSLTALIISKYSWRPAFRIIGLPSIIIGFIIYCYIRDNAEDHPRIKPDELRLLKDNEKMTENALATEKEINYKEITYKEFTRKPLLWKIVFIWATLGVTYCGVITWLPTFLITEMKLTLTQTSMIGILPFLVGACSLVLGGYMSDKAEGKRKYLFSLAGILSAVFLYATALASFTILNVLFQCLAMFFLFYASGVFWGFVTDFCPPRIMGSITGTVNFGGQVGSFFSPFIIGFILKNSAGNFNMVFIFLGLSITISSIISLTTKPIKQIGD